MDRGQQVPFVEGSVDRFTNAYFKTLLRWNARELGRGEALFIPTDVVLVVNRKYRPYVEAFANNEQLFFAAFAKAYGKLVEIGFR